MSNMSQGFAILEDAETSSEMMWTPAVSLCGILQGTPLASDRILACLHQENLSRMMMSSPTLRTCCENSVAAEEIWRKAVRCLDSINNLRFRSDLPDVEDPRFIVSESYDSFTENTAFASMSLRLQWTKLFKFQALCINNLLSCFEIGGRRYVCKRWNSLCRSRARSLPPSLPPFLARARALSVPL